MGRGGPGAGRQNSKALLASLVDKLDLLTRKPLTIELTPHEKAKLAEQLQGLAEQEKLSDEEAKKKLDNLVALLKDNKDSLQAVGFRWPGESGPALRPPADSPNPFKEEGNNNHLKDLQERLGQKPAEKESKAAAAKAP